MPGNTPPKSCQEADVSTDHPGGDAPEPGAEQAWRESIVAFDAARVTGAAEHITLDARLGELIEQLRRARAQYAVAERSCHAVTAEDAAATDAADAQLAAWARRVEAAAAAVEAFRRERALTLVDGSQSVVEQAVTVLQRGL